MLDGDAKLNDKLFDEGVESKPTRDGFGAGSVEAGKEDENVVVLCADLSESTRAEWFEKEFPERFIEMGIGEQNMAATAAGFAEAGKVPFIASYAAFNPGRNYEQIRTTIALNQVPVKVCGMHAGVSVGPDGATHQMLEDMGLMRMLPNMEVIYPADSEEARKAVLAAAKSGKPTYLRFAREATPVMTTAETPFEIGKAYAMWCAENPEAVIIGTGPLLAEALKAAKKLDEEGVKTMVINLHTIKPLDGDTLRAVAKEAGAVVTVEEHQAMGGMGSAVAEYLAQHEPVPVEFVGIKDRFGQSGEPAELIRHYGLDADAIAEAARKVIARKP